MNPPNSEQDQKSKKISLNVILVLIALLFVSVFGIIFLTQIEIQPGWKNVDHSQVHHGDFYFIMNDDLTGDSKNETFCYFRVQKGTNVANNTPQYGYVDSRDAVSGALIWKKELSGPVITAYKLHDMNNDGISDFLINFATVNSSWNTDDSNPSINSSLYGNQILSGINGKVIPILEGDLCNISREYIFDCVVLDGSTDFIVIQRNNSWYNYDDFTDNQNLTRFFENGTIRENLNISTKILFMDLLPNNTESNLLLIGDDFVSCRSVDNFSEIIFENGTVGGEVDNYCITDDLGNDGISEFFLIKGTGEILLINGSNGELLNNHSYISGYDLEGIIPIRNTAGELTNDYLLSWHLSVGDGVEYNIIENCIINTTYNKSNWIFTTDTNAISLESDFTGDGYPEIVFAIEEPSTFTPIPTMDVRVVNGRNPTQIISQLKIQNQIDKFHLFSDIDGDLRKDIYYTSYTEHGALSSRTPIGIWLSPTYIFFSLPIFILLVCVCAYASYRFIRAFIRKEFEMKIKENVKRFKITVAVNIATIATMIFMFLFFLFGMNVFNTTLLLYDPLGSMMMTSIIVFITWFTLLPIVGAIFNKSSSRFSYYFIKLRDRLFKLSKKIDHDILVIEVDPKKGIGIVEVVKRAILPMLLSLTVGFLIYNYIGPLFGIKQNFTTLGGSEFYEFIGGYMLYAILPMTLTFVLSSFFISSGWLLDDAGVVYYHKYREEHIPGDVERMSVWQQGWIKGLAGFSSLITFYLFASGINLTSMLTNTGGNVAFNILGFITTSLIFYGFPFITGFCYMFFAVTMMEVSIDENRDKLYGMMEKGGYDVTPKNLEMMLYPGGFKESKVTKELKGST